MYVIVVMFTMSLLRFNT